MNSNIDVPPTTADNISSSFDDTKRDFNHCHQLSALNKSQTHQILHTYQMQEIEKIKQMKEYARNFFVNNLRNFLKNTFKGVLSIFKQNHKKLFKMLTKLMKNILRRSSSLRKLKFISFFKKATLHIFCRNLLREKLK